MSSILKDSIRAAQQEAVDAAKAEYLTILNRRHKPHATDGRALVDAMLRIGKTESDFDADVDALDRAEVLRTEAAGAAEAKADFENARIQAQEGERAYTAAVEQAEAKRYAAQKAKTKAQNAWSAKNKAAAELKQLCRRHSDVLFDGD